MRRPSRADRDDRRRTESAAGREGLEPAGACGPCRASSSGGQLLGEESPHQPARARGGAHGGGAGLANFRPLRTRAGWGLIRWRASGPSSSRVSLPASTPRLQGRSLSRHLRRKDPEGNAVPREVGAGAEALPVSRRAFHRPEDSRRARAHRSRSTAPVHEEGGTAGGIGCKYVRLSYCKK
jgi:hypothetical protein